MLPTAVCQLTRRLVLHIQQIVVCRAAAQIAEVISREADCFAAGALPAGQIGRLTPAFPKQYSMHCVGMASLPRGGSLLRC
jgi:hypothetical protein